MIFLHKCAPKSSTCFSAFRRATLLVLFSLFLWQAVSSLLKFSQGRTTITVETVVEKMFFTQQIVF